MSLGKEIKKARIDKSWQQKDLHEATGLSQKYLSEIELDKVDPRFSVVKRIARALGVSLDTLAKDDEITAFPPPARPAATAVPTKPPAARQKAAKPSAKRPRPRKAASVG